MKTRSDHNPAETGYILLICALTFLVMSVRPSFGQIDTAGNKKHDKDAPVRYLSLFEDEDILEVSLHFDLTRFLKKADRDQSIDGIMTLHFSQADSMEKKVTAKYRGQSRYERCKYPPARITFKKPVYEGSDSGRIKKIKLVNQCQPATIYEDYLIREYLVYKLYNVVTDTSFRVRLVRLNYIDTEKKRKPIIQYGMLVEPEGLVESRLNLLEVKSKALSMRHMRPTMIDRIAIFNYMVSNWDWSVPGQHNISVFTSPIPSLAGQGIPIPFDFDLAGVVNADYAIPLPETGLTSNRDRTFLGICRSREVFVSELKVFISKKDEFYSVVENSPHLRKAAKRDITFFLDQFFDQLEKPRGFDRMVDLFLANCKDFQ
ncbi:MAG: hypothetical protein P1P83_06065 [Bacteroidales bacterium]|nr:hypothetical protein [Bacteroidales bacterium]MDT8373341.1 hypothetical protein [Bacteroidales bacterium]